MSQTVFNIDGETLITPKQIAAFSIITRQDPASDDEARGKAQLGLLLGLTQDRLRSGEAAERAVDYLFRQLHIIRRDYEPAAWQRLLEIAQGHPVAGLLHQDPFTRWSFEKPRGYSGDARLLDFIYRHPSVEPDLAGASTLGRAIHAYTSEAPAAAAVRERREILARTVDEATAACGGGSEILTIAGGHLREAALSQALGQGGIARWVALDQDPMSVGTMTRDLRGTAVEAVDGSVKGLLGNAYRLGQFDLVYAAGLYDYLPRSASIRLTRTCLAMLKPGGRFLFANFARGISDDGYMESFMNWPLLLRSEAEVEDIMAASASADHFSSEIFYGANRNIIYGVLRKLG